RPPAPRRPRPKRQRPRRRPRRRRRPRPRPARPSGAPRARRARAGNVGQKTHPYGFRLGIIKPWRSRYFARRDFPELLKEDDLIRKDLKARLSHAGIDDVAIERTAEQGTHTVPTGRRG